MNLLLHDRPYWPSGPSTQIDYQSIESIEAAIRGAKKYYDADPTDLYHKGGYEYLMSLALDCYHGLDRGSAPTATTMLPSEYPAQ